MMLFLVGNSAKNFSGSIATCVQSVGQPIPLDRGAVPVLEVSKIVEALRQHLGGACDYALHCPFCWGGCMLIPPLV